MIFVNTLSPEARQALEDLTQHAPGRVAQRAWMVLWSAEQVPVPEIARCFHCREKTVRKWLRRYQRGELAGLPERPRSGRPSRLTAGAEQAIFTQVNQPPWTFGYVFAFWSVATLAQHLATRYWQRVSPWLVRRMLLKLGYRCRRPKLGPRLVDPQREAVHLQLVYLPKYAAHRDNLIEKLGWRLKGFITANRCCRSMDELLAVGDKFFKQLTPDQVFQLVA